MFVVVVVDDDDGTNDETGLSSLSTSKMMKMAMKAKDMHAKDTNFGPYFGCLAFKIHEKSAKNANEIQNGINTHALFNTHHTSYITQSHNHPIVTINRYFCLFVLFVC